MSKILLNLTESFDMSLWSDNPVFQTSQFFLPKVSNCPCKLNLLKRMSGENCELY